MALYQKQIMQEKDRYLRKVNYIILIILILFSFDLYGENKKLKLLNYNENLKDSSAFFTQTDGLTVEEGKLYIGVERLRLDYDNPEEITIVLTKKRGMYVNHRLKEAQFFNTQKSFVSVFFSLLTDINFYENSDIIFTNYSIVISHNIKTEQESYKTKIIYENNPVKLRKIEVQEEDRILEIGFYEHNNEESLDDNFFSLISPYLD